MPRLALSWLDESPADPRENLDLDEALLYEGRGVLRVWEVERECVVLGRAGQPESDVHLVACRRGGVPVLRRCSGGGAVLLGAGCLNYTLVLPLEWDPRWSDVRYSLRWILARMKQAIGLPQLRREEPCDLALDRRKVSGSAQRRTRSAILHHGTLLYKFDAARAERFLKAPARQPRYRAGRSHRDFLGNLPMTAAELRRRLAEGWC